MKPIVSTALCIAVLLLTGCKSKATAPPRPTTVPPSAIWAGGADGGSFFECDVDAAHDVNRCLVYNDHTGDVEGGGFFRLEGLNRAARSDELQFQFFDGERISLAGHALVPVPAVRPDRVPPDAVLVGGLFISCGKLVSDRTECSVYRPDGGAYFSGTFVAESAQETMKYKFFDLSDRTLYLQNGGRLIGR